MKKNIVIAALSAGLLASCAGAPAEDHGSRYKASDVVVSGPGEASCVTLSQAQAEQALALTNAKRSSGGLTPLRVNRVMMKIAADHACYQARSGVMSHAGKAGEGPKHRAKAAGYKPVIIAENIASGPYSVTQAVSAWNGSAGHIANIMLPQTRHFGIGSAVGPNGFVYWTAVYAAGS